MSRRRLMWRDKLGYNPMPMREDHQQAWRVSQCGGSKEKLISTFPANMKKFPKGIKLT